MAVRNKTIKGVAKRIRLTGTGKLRYNKSGKRHLNAHFTGKRSRQLRRPGIITASKIVAKYTLAIQGQ